MRNGAYPHNSTCTHERIATPAHVIAAAIHIANNALPTIDYGAHDSVPERGVFSIIHTLGDIIIPTPMRVNRVLLPSTTKANISIITAGSMTRI